MIMNSPFNSIDLSVYIVSEIVEGWTYGKIHPNGVKFSKNLHDIFVSAQTS